VVVLSPGSQAHEGGRCCSTTRAAFARTALFHSVKLLSGHCEETAASCRLDCVGAQPFLSRGGRAPCAGGVGGEQRVWGGGDTAPFGSFKLAESPPPPNGTTALQQRSTAAMARLSLALAAHLIGLRHADECVTRVECRPSSTRQHLLVAKRIALPSLHLNAGVGIDAHWPASCGFLWVTLISCAPCLHAAYLPAYLPVYLFACLPARVPASNMTLL
jgi:hypothetical protein